MKKAMALFMITLILLGLVPFASAANTITLQPGMYEVGKEIPSGHYDIRFQGMDKGYVKLAFSDRQKDDGALDLETYYSFALDFSTAQNWWNVGGFVCYLPDGYLSVEGCSIVLYEE